MADIDIPLGLLDKETIRKAILPGVVLTGATITFLYHRADQTDVQKVVACTIHDVDQNLVDFTWPGETAGLFYGQYKAVFSGSPMHWPADRLLTIRVIAEP